MIITLKCRVFSKLLLEERELCYESRTGVSKEFFVVCMFTKIFSLINFLSQCLPKKNSGTLVVRGICAFSKLKYLFLKKKRGCR